jgi:hypothetical protein
MNIMKILLTEAFLVGVLIIPLGFLVLGLSFFLQNNVKLYRDMGPNFIMITGFFALGFITHIVCELSGINKWYCKNGNACR